MLAVSGINFLQRANSASTFNNQQRPSVKVHSQPIQDCVSFCGLPRNFGEVALKKGISMGKFFRSALPEDFQALKNEGIKYVMDLRTMAERNFVPEENAVKELGMEYITPDLPDITEGLQEYLIAVKKLVKDIKILLERNDGALIVHCEKGERRTGQVVAAFQHYVDELSTQEIINHAQNHRTDTDMIRSLCRVMRAFQVD